jgi:hypothetical protein
MQTLMEFCAGTIEIGTYDKFIHAQGGMAPNTRMAWMCRFEGFKECLHSRQVSQALGRFVNSIRKMSLNHIQNGTSVKA